MIGESIGSYRIVAKLGEGGMGAVYLGEHRRIARRVAIKVLLPELSHNQQVVDRFFNEARATSLIRHPGIVEVSDCDVLPSGNAYIVMELLEGESLGNCLRRVGRLSLPRALLVTRNIANALEAAHQQRIVHRDLKPDNVFLLGSTAGSSAEPIKILDFGIAKLMHTNPGDGRYKTRTGSLLGTPVYMSPEQCRGVGTIDHRTDIYSLGCMLFEMLCGHPPFTSEGFGELIQSHLSVTPARLRSIDPAFSEALDALVARMLAKSPADRPQTMRALVAELDAIAAGAPNDPAAASTPNPPMGIDERIAAPTGAAGPAGATVLLPTPALMQMPKVQTTLGSASSERMPVVSLADEADVPKTRRAGPIWAAAALAVVVGGFGIWRATKHGSHAPAGGSSTTATTTSPAPVTTSAPSTAPPIAPPSPVAAPRPTVTPPLIATSGPTVAASPMVNARPKATPPPVERPAPTPSPPRERKVKVVITSEPSGADVCLKNDRVLLGRTRLSWIVDKSPHEAKLLIRKRGYRGQEISVVPDREVKEVVTLDKLGPDDIDNTDNCQRK
jgi:eukaryotic-like serine/threonine-protein kinase